MEAAQEGAAQKREEAGLNEMVMIDMLWLLISQEAVRVGNAAKFQIQDW